MKTCKFYLAKKMNFIIYSFFTLVMFFPNSVFGQNYSTKITEAINEMKENVKTWVTGILVVVLLIGIIGMVYKLTNSDPKAKEGVIAWIIGVIISGLAVTILTLN